MADLQAPWSPEQIRFSHDALDAFLTPEVLAAIGEGLEADIGGTDLGQTGNPTPADGLQMFVTGLLAEGITRV